MWGIMYRFRIVGSFGFPVDTFSRFSRFVA